MKCFEDPAQFLCKAVCGGNMTCCGRSCKAHCHRCQTLNLLQGDSATEADDSPVPRIQHVPHPCERTLYCGHLCGKACSQNHECTPFCKETCRQVCQHARCKHYCSTPCAPCQESCTWYVIYHLAVLRNNADTAFYRKCAHHSCPVPCGSVSPLLLVLRDVLKEISPSRSVPVFRVINVAIKIWRAVTDVLQVTRYSCGCASCTHNSSEHSLRRRLFHPSLPPLRN